MIGTKFELRPVLLLLEFIEFFNAETTPLAQDLILEGLDKSIHPDGDQSFNNLEFGF